jgi:chromosome segregation ATPase
LKSLLLENFYKPTAAAVVMETVHINELKLKSQNANQLIEKLKHQIEQIKIQTTPNYVADKIKNLKSENESLKKRVEELKKELEEAEAGKASSSIGLDRLNFVG